MLIDDGDNELVSLKANRRTLRLLTGFVADSVTASRRNCVRLVKIERLLDDLLREYQNQGDKAAVAWNYIEPWVCPIDATTVGDALRALGCLRVEGHHFVRGLVCPGCGCRDEAMRMDRPLARCTACNRRMVPADFGYLDHLDNVNAPDFSDLTLSSVGFLAGDILSGYGRHRVLKEPA